VGGEEGSCALADTNDNAVLIRERVTTGLEDDLLKRGHIASVRGAADIR
jgi:hypothetical protein